MKVGFTGTREGMTAGQTRAFAKWLSDNPIDEFHHGSCIGADAHAFWAVVRNNADHDEVYPQGGCKTHAHPSNMPGMTDKGARDSSNVQYLPLEPLARNRAIVDACDVLIACPKGPEELQSGTWSTVRYARKCSKRVIIILPDGTVTEE